MKKIFTMIAVMAALAGCGPTQYTTASDGMIVTQEAVANESCYKGVVYVQFSGGNASWGSVKFNGDTGLPVTCGAPK